MSLKKKKKRSSSVLRSSNNNTSREDTSSEGYLDPENGLGRIHGRFLNNDTFQEYGGSIYDKQADGSFKKRDW